VKTETLGRALARLDIGVMIGDRHHDIDAGRAHGLTTVGVLWGISIQYDQQAAGMIMKVVGGTYLWVLIGILFIKFVQASEHGDRARGIQPDRRTPEDDLLTWADVEHELATAPPAPREP
jgi:hypothetical protein